MSTHVAKALSIFHPSTSGRTVEFIEVFDRFFDFLNVRCKDESRRKNKEEVAPFESVHDWRLKVNKLILAMLSSVVIPSASQLKTGFQILVRSYLLF